VSERLGRRGQRGLPNVRLPRRELTDELQLGGGDRLLRVGQRGRRRGEERRPVERACLQHSLAVPLAERDADLAAAGEQGQVPGGTFAGFRRGWRQPVMELRVPANRALGEVPDERVQASIEQPAPVE
jgi:hypothetical protein